MRALVAALVAIAVLLAASSASAGDTAAQQLADRYAPIVALQVQKKACGPGEPYRPLSVDVVLGNADVKLRGPRGFQALEAPTAKDVYGRGEDYYLDLPGNPLRPGCKYEKELRRWGRGHPNVAYAHIASDADEPGRLALQYWLYYGFNDFNDKHESDWEMIQLAFDAPNAEAALRTVPSEVVYSQHGGAERADWDSDKLEKVGTHPVAYAAAGSHANYYWQALWLGRSASEGFGCDDTRGPSKRVSTKAILLPTTVTTPSDENAWVRFVGRWGQRERGVNNGPTGPSTKTQWLAPLGWQDDARGTSVVVPGADGVGPSVTGFFCDAVAAGSSALLFAQSRPVLALVVVLGLLAFAGVLLTRTRWGPADPYPLRQTRAGGQILRAAARLYRRHAGVFVGIGLGFLPLAALQWLLFGSWLRGLAADRGHWSGVVDLIAFVVNALGVVTAAVVVHSATAVAVGAIAEGRRPRVRDAYRRVGARFKSLLAALVRILGLSFLLLFTVLGIPVAVERLVRWAFLPQACVIDGKPAGEARRESVRLVRGSWWRTLAVSGVVVTIVLLVGPLLGVVLLLMTDAPLPVVNLVGSLVYVLAYPYAGIAATLLYFDRLETATPAARAAPAPQPV